MMPARIPAVVVLLFLALQSQAQKPVFIHAADSIEKAVNLYDNAEYDKAISLFKYVHPGDTNYLTAHYELTMTYVAAEQYEKGIEMALEGLEMETPNEQLYFNILGTAYDDSGDSIKALETYNKAISRFPMYYNLYYNRSVVHQKLKDYQAALADLKKTVELNPFHASAHLALADMALNEGKYTQALMSVCYFLMIEPGSQRANEVLQYYHQVVSDKVELTSKKLTLSTPADDYDITDKLITSYVALRDDYKGDSKVKLALVNQLHLALSQVAKNKRRKGFWEMYYAPMLTDLMKEDYFETFSYYILISSGNEFHQKMVSKSQKDRSEFVTWAGNKIKEHHGLHPEGYTASGKEVKYWFYENSSAIEAVGKVGKENTPLGDYQFYYTSGSLLSKGAYDENGEKTGEWKRYHPNGKLKQVSFYQKGKVEGESKEYHENGELFAEATYKDDDLNGTTKIYDESGILLRSLIYNDNILEDSIIYYYADGSISSVVPIKEGILSGRAKYYYEDRSLKADLGWAEDKYSGPFTYYHPNGKVSSEGNYKNGYYEGPYKSFHYNGTIASEGKYLEGTQIGKWTEYYPNGKVSEKEEFDEKGKLNGSSESYSALGFRTNLILFSKGEVKEYKYFGRNGEVIYENKRRFGKFDFEGYSPDKIKTAEGSFNGDLKEGRWTYYTSNGELRSIEEYDSKGNQIGDAIYYHRDGVESERLEYREGKADGYHAYYHSNGQIKGHGYNVDGKANGPWNYYYPDGTMESSNFFVNGSLNGPQYYYNEGGELYSIRTYKHGVTTKIASTNPDSTAYHLEEISGGKSTHRALYPNGNEIYNLTAIGQKLWGPANWTYGNGKPEVKGQYVNDERHGNWKWYYPNGQVETEGHYHLGKKIGEWSYYFDNGKINYIAHYENGELQGDYTVYYRDGKLDYKATYDNGLMHGKRYFYDGQDNVDHIRVYEYGRIVGFFPTSVDDGEMIPLERETGVIKSKFANGNGSREYTLLNGNFHGPYKSYYLNGSLRYEVTFVHGDKDKAQVEYYPNGKKLSELQYVNGLLHGETVYYYPSGKVRKRENYLQGALHGPMEVYDENGKLTNKYNFKGGSMYEEI